MNDEGWADIPYHFLIASDGTCFASRDLKWQGAHVANYNKGNIGICFLGCFESNPHTHDPNDEPEHCTITEVMIKKAAELIAKLTAHYQIKLSRETLKTHSDYDPSTLCPGNLIISEIDKILEIAIQHNVSNFSSELGSI